ncbi:MAG: hypothetical protein R3C44_15445 [Chloroflexota bacterium]
MAQPYFYWRKHRMATIIPLLRYFNGHDYTGHTRQLAEVCPSFKVTSLAEYVQRLLV